MKNTKTYTIHLDDRDSVPQIVAGLIFKRLASRVHARFGTGRLRVTTTYNKSRILDFISTIAGGIE
jgi:hypothetical protein